MKHILPAGITRLIDLLQRLPGIGPKMAGRLALFLLTRPDEELTELGQTITALKSGIVRCAECYNFTTVEEAICQICSDGEREQTALCVVEAPLDVVAIERTRSFLGRYHVLGGVISPIDGIGPDQLTIAALITRIKDSATIREIVVATNPSLEGEATAIFIKSEIERQLPDRKLAITRIARGIPSGGALEYADSLTLSRALEGRSKY